MNWLLWAMFTLVAIPEQISELDWRTCLYQRADCHGAACINRVLAGERSPDGQRITVWRNR